MNRANWAPDQSVREGASMEGLSLVFELFVCVSEFEMKKKKFKKFQGLKSKKREKIHFLRFLDLGEGTS